MIRITLSGLVAIMSVTYIIGVYNIMMPPILFFGEASPKEISEGFVDIKHALTLSMIVFFAALAYGEYLCQGHFLTFKFLTTSFIGPLTSIASSLPVIGYIAGIFMFSIKTLKIKKEGIKTITVAQYRKLTHTNRELPDPFTHPLGFADENGFHQLLDRLNHDFAINFTPTQKALLSFAICESYRTALKTQKRAAHEGNKKNTAGEGNND